jgi:uncharacterized protein with PIN domain
MFQRSKMTAEMSQQLIEQLTEGGTRDLSQMRIDDLENEVYEAVDAITERVLRGMLEEQVGGCRETRCPRCGGELDDKPPKETTLTCKRGAVSWSQPVKRCKSCRCDFFPSGQSSGD